MVVAKPPKGVRVAARRFAAVGVSLTALLLHTATFAADVTEEYRRRVESAQNLTALTDSLLGDQVSLYNGQTEFSVTDIDIPGNFPLPVSLTRRFSVELLTTSSGGMSWDPSLGGAGHWDIDVPHISGTFSSAGWTYYTASGPSSARCSTTGTPNVPSHMQLNEIWQGNTVHVPGESDRSMLLASAQTIKPTGSASKWTTRERDTFSCVAAGGSVAGEGFAMTTAAGVTYRFDRGVSRPVSIIRRSLGESLPAVSASRQKIYLLATEVSDRFNNWVRYQYNAAGNPTLITASDARRISFTYDTQGRLTSATAGEGPQARQWIYRYHPSYPLRLQEVELPDTSKWTYSYSNDLVVEVAPYDGNTRADCNEQAPTPPADFTLQVTHPQGAQGQFTFLNRRMRRSGVHLNNCLQRVQGATYYWELAIPHFFDVMSLVGKQITGPALPQMTWSYNYGGTDYDLVNYSGAYCSGAACPEKKTVVVTQPDMSKVEYDYGVRYNYNEGRLLEERVKTAQGALLRATSTTYLPETKADTQTFAPVHGLGYGGQDSSSYTIRPIVGKTISQDGVSFSSIVPEACSGKYCFDNFARQTRQTKASSLGFSRTTDTTYHDHLGKWVLGQAKKTQLIASVPAMPSQPVISEVIFNANALPETIQSFGQTEQVLTYNSNGSIASITDGRSKTTWLRDWKRGVPQEIAFPSTNAVGEAPGGAKRTAVVDDNGWVVGTTDENGYLTAYDHDGMGRVNFVAFPDEPVDSPVQWADTTKVFSPVGAIQGFSGAHWQMLTSTGQAKSLVRYDGFLRPVIEQRWDAASEGATRSVVVKRYDVRGNLVFESYPLRTVADYKSAALKGKHFTYDGLGRIKKVREDADGGDVLETNTDYLSGFRVRVQNPRGFQTITAHMAWDEPTHEYPLLIDSPEGVRTVIERDAFGKPKLIERSGSDG